MSTRHREPVGHYRCPNTAGCEQTGIIYRQPDGVLYGVCRRCGPLYWRTPEGQEFFLSKGTIWGADGPPPAVAELLAQVNKRRKPSASPAPVDPSPKPAPAPVVTDTAKPAPATQEQTPAPRPAPKPETTPKRNWWQL